MQIPSYYYRLKLMIKPKKQTKAKYPPPDVIYVDVDGTLLVNGKPNPNVVRLIREKHEDGFQIIVWSSRGSVNAIRAVGLAGLNDIVSHKLSKPGYIVDDKGWSWTRYTEQIKDI